MSSEKNLKNDHVVLKMDNYSSLVFGNIAILQR